MREARSVLFGRTLARARLALAAGRGIDTLALVGGAGLLAGAIGARGFGTAAPWIPATLAVLLWRLRGAIPSRAECARALDRRHGTGEVASSALVARTAVGELCLRTAEERFGPKEVATLALPTAPPLAAAGLAACVALALLSLGPAGADLVDVSEDLAAVEAFGAAVGAEGRPEGAELARKAAATRRALSRDVEASKDEIESLARKALSLAEERRTREGEAAGTKEARSAAGRLLAVAGERGRTHPGGGGTSGEGRGATSASGPDRPAGRTSFLAVDVPFEYREVVARYFERGD
jgi:hypothetical protein